MSKEVPVEVMRELCEASVAPGWHVPGTPAYDRRQDALSAYRAAKAAAEKPLRTRAERDAQIDEWARHGLDPEGFGTTADRMFEALQRIRDLRAEPTRPDEPPPERGLTEAERALWKEPLMQQAKGIIEDIYNGSDIAPDSVYGKRLNAWLTAFDTFVRDERRKGGAQPESPHVGAVAVVNGKRYESAKALSDSIPGGCYCPPDKCMAPVISGKQTPCLRRKGGAP